MNWLNYHHLYYFYVIAKEGAVAKAARKLSLGQPTLSTQLKIFEDHLGYSLFDREKKKLLLTTQGKIVFDYASEIFRLGSEMLDALQDRKKPEKLRLQIGAFDSVPKQVIYSLIEKANAITPSFVAIEEGPEKSLLESLVSHKLDLVVSNSPAPIAPKTVCRSKLLGSVPMIVCGGKKFEKLKKGFPKSINNQPMMLPAYSSLVRDAVERFFMTNSVELNVLGEAQDPEIQKLMALSGTSLVVLNRATVVAQIASGDLLEIGELKGVQEQIWLSCGIRHHAHPVVEVLMNDFELPNLK